MEVDDDVEDDDMDFDPLSLLRSPSETSSSGLTSEAECEGTSFENQPSTLRDSPGDKNAGDSALPQRRIPAKGVGGENVPACPSAQLCRENGEVHVNRLGEESLQTEISLSPSVPNSHPLLVETNEKDVISKRALARYSLSNYALEELETFLLESDDEGNLRNDEEEEYRKYLADVLSCGGDDTQACQGGETQNEDENDADIELGIEEALESNGDQNVQNCENINGRNEKDAHRPRTRKKRHELSRAVHRHESTKSNVRPILPNSSSVLLAPQNASHGINAPSSSSSVNGAAVVEGFTDEQLGQLHMMIYEHVQLMIQTFSLSVLDPSKQCVAADVKKMIVELVGCRDQALARRTTIHQQFCFESQHLQSALHASFESSQCQWIPLIRNPVMSILDVSPLHLALSYLSDVEASVVKHRKSLVDGTAEKKNSRKEPLFASRVLSTDKDANNVSQDRSNKVSAASPASPGQLPPKKTLAATIVESTQKETVALVPFDIARLAQRFYPFFNISLFPRKPPPAAVVQRVHFTDAEEGLLALGILEYNNDWDTIQKRLLPCKSTHQIYVRQKNRSSSSAPDNPVKEVRRMKNSPLSTEEIQRVEEGLKTFKNDWTSVWKFVLPYRDPAQLQRQWKVANGVQRSYSKSDALKEKRRIYEAKRKKTKASVPDSRRDRGQEADNDASEAKRKKTKASVPDSRRDRGQEADNDASEVVENDDNSNVNEVFIADTENSGANMMQTGTSPDNERVRAHDCFEQNSRNSLSHGVSASYIPFSSCASDGPSTKRVFGGTLDGLQASQCGKEKGSHVVKLAPDVPAVNLSPSVHVISQEEFHQNAAHFNGTLDNAANDLFPVPPATFTECVYTQLNLFPDHSASDSLQQQHPTLNGIMMEDGAEQDFPMHSLLFQHAPQVLSSYSHQGENLTSHSSNYNLFPFEKIQVEKSNRQTTNGMEEGAPVNANTIDFHPLLQRIEAEMHWVPEEYCHQFANQSDCRVMEPPDIEEPSEETMQGIVIEQEALSESEEDSQHVEFECEEINDSEEEQVKDAEPCLTEKKGISASVVCSDFLQSNDQCQIQQGLEQVVKQGARLTHKSHGSSSARSSRAKLKPEPAKRMGTRRSQRLANKRT